MGSWGVDIWDNDNSLDVIGEQFTNWCNSIKECDNLDDLLAYTSIILWFKQSSDLPKHLYEDQIKTALNFAKKKIIKLNKKQIGEWHDADMRQIIIDNFLSRL